MTKGDKILLNWDNICLIGTNLHLIGAIYALITLHQCFSKWAVEPPGGRPCSKGALGGYGVLESGTKI